MKIIATYSSKGGVGKTATAVNLAYLSCQEGARTLVWDLDPQGATSFYFRIKPKIRGGGKRLIRGKRSLDSLIKGTDFSGLDLLPADFSYRNLDLVLDGAKKGSNRLRRLLAPLSSHYDRVFLDCAPSLSLVSEGIFVAAHILLVPTIPTILSMRSLEQLDKMLGKKKSRKLQVLPFFCMVDRRKSLHRQICEDAQPTPFSFLNTHIPYSSLVEQMGPRRAPLLSFARSSMPARRYQELWNELKVQGG